MKETCGKKNAMQFLPSPIALLILAFYSIGGVMALAQGELPAETQTLRQKILDHATDQVVRAEAVEKEEGKRALLKEARQICERILEVPDPFSGDAISLLLRIVAMEQNEDGVLKYINAEVTKHQALERPGGRPVAPHPSLLAALRFHRAELYHRLAREGVEEKDGEKVKQYFIKAYEEYLRTFLKYEREKWGVQAGQSLLEISDWARTDFGAKMVVGGGHHGVLKKRIENAANLLAEEALDGAGE